MISFEGMTNQAINPGSANQELHLGKGSNKVYFAQVF